MRNRQVDNKSTFQARLDIGWRPMLLKLRATTGKTIKQLVENALCDAYALDERGEPYEIKRGSNT